MIRNELSVVLSRAGGVFLRASCAVTLLLSLLTSSPVAFALPKTHHVGPSKTDCDYGRIQDAIDNSGSDDTILIDATGTYASQHLNITSKSLVFGTGPCKIVVGGRPEGTQAATVATLSGDAAASSAVISIGGAVSVSLNDLKISGNTNSGN
ncbi:MAG TPA: hypothetical protein VGI75_14310, partial [Pirellulales bacterium]